MNVSLVKPTIKLQNEYINLYQEWKDSGENMVPWVISKDPSDFHKMVQFLIDSEKGLNLPKGWVPDSTYWLITDQKKAKKLGIQKALVVCDESNIGSEKTIIKNGGIHDSNYIEEDGNVVKRYWIEL